ncbi:autotransporter domain-containing protein [Halioxenophilus sp. WMMB6]|uniref:autotransporter domain-containing protein n=1 Tax=Halioxenophilus sp. WMMB6 TaxID=3073815 RepID=UPI00295ECC70|nr:autotransporter domain-containing protein [Halioxenophilus sp. WMMB6]
MFKRRLLAITLAATCAAPVWATDYSNVIFFGDSLTDSGTYIGQPDIAGIFPIEGKFTTNPGLVWSELVGAQLGIIVAPANQSGTNYAAGGARVSEQPGYPNSALVPFIQTAPSVSDQITTYLASTGGQTDDRALYTLWAGANDLFALQDGDAAYNALPMSDVAANMVDEIARLKDAGAKHIVLFNLPDIGGTPAAVADGPAAQAEASQFTDEYNQALFAELAAQGISVIVIDTYHMLQFQQANAAAFGITNTTDIACAGQPTSLVCGAGEYPAGADQTYTYADGVHPTSKTHEILADFVLSVLAAPQQVGLLADSSQVLRSNLHDQLRQQTRKGAATREQQQRNLWLAAAGSALERDAANNDPGTEEDGYQFALGVDFQVNEQWVVGVAVSANDSDSDYDRQAGDYSISDVSLSLVGQWQQSAWYAFGALTYGKSEYDTNRRVSLAGASFNVDGSTDGSNTSAMMELGYQISFGVMTTGPIVGLLGQELRIDGFDESGEAVLTLGYGNQKRNSLVATLGWQAELDFDAIKPYARVTFGRDLEDNDHSVTITTLSLPEAMPYQMPVSGPGETRYSAELGLSGLVSDTITYQVGAVSHFGQDEQSDWLVGGGLTFAF